MIFDDIIDKNLADTIEDWFTKDTFPWYYNKTTVTNQNQFENIAFDYPQFVHLFYKYEQGKVIKNSELADYPMELFGQFAKYKQIEEAIMLRCKANLQMSVVNDKKFNHPHLDLDQFHPEKYYVLLYYVNDSDGDTFLFDKDFNITHSISPKKGRFLLFDGNVYHAGRHPLKNSTRIVINFDFKLPDGGLL